MENEARKPMGRPPRGPYTPEEIEKRKRQMRRPRPSKFERVSPKRFEAAEKQILVLLGRNLREARRRAGMTQTDVANIVHSSQPFIGAIERAARNITLFTLVRLAYAVRTDPGALLLGDHAANYSLETLTRLVGALHAHLQAAMGDPTKSPPEGELLTLIAPPSFQFNVEETPETADRDAKRKKKG
jgi:transcriptional regulator with XRE-family HTH domain